MTAEIAIMNKTAIALAADSAVTVRGHKGVKMYNTVNKLFALSKYHPVGIMIFGNAELNRLPWEIIIKIYRRKLGKKRYNTLNEYASDFINFLVQNDVLFPEAVQLEFFKITVSGYFYKIKKEINDQVESIIKKEGKIPEPRIAEIVDSIINEHNEQWERTDKLPNIEISNVEEIIKKYGENIKLLKDNIFQNLPITDASFAKLRNISVQILFKNRFPKEISGVVIAGYGEEEFFPALVSYIIEGKACNILKYLKNVDAKVDFVTHAWILPFAQREMVATFMEGIAPTLNISYNNFLREIFNKYPDYILEKITKLEKEEKVKLADELKKIGKDIISDIETKMQDFRRQNFINPITSAVALLPKDELALMAESLVNLTSFKQKITMESETVKEPIDVAVISKGDGFVWIKRKNYFKFELNPYFIKNYYRD